jgi:hypothetical protein
MSSNAEAFDRWIRTSFVAMNTELEELYFAQERKHNVEGVGDAIKTRIRDEGREYIVALLNEGNTDEGFESAFGVLGNLGFYVAALRRHELTTTDQEGKDPPREASALGLHIGASIGLPPRFVTSHLTTVNRAKEGKPKTFTALPDEKIFLDYNTIGIFAYKKAADALARIVPLGVSHPVALHLFDDARRALEEVGAIDDALDAELDVQRFFFNVRPYYFTHRVGRTIYRGPNAGDFSAINEIDLLLGLCQANDLDYAQVLVEKGPYTPIEDQARLRDALRRTSLLDEFMALKDKAKEPWFQANARAFLEVCDMHGKVAEKHHNRLVARFVAQPSNALDEKERNMRTASGAEFADLIRTLAKLRDQRMAAPGRDFRTAHKEIAALKAAIGWK